MRGAAKHWLTIDVSCSCDPRMPDVYSSDTVEQGEIANYRRQVEDSIHIDKE